MKPAVPHAVQLLQIKIRNIPAEWLIPTQVEDAEKTILYFHGGAWLFGWYNTHRMLVGHITKQTRKQALAIDYRLAPEYPFPAALDDCLAAYHYLLDLGICSDQVIIRVIQLVVIWSLHACWHFEMPVSHYQQLGCASVQLPI
jgi:epsilon-lactone hydrolase